MLITCEINQDNSRYYLAQMRCKTTGKTILAEGATRVRASSAALYVSLRNQMKAGTAK